MVAQALRSARAMWSACPMRKLWLVIGFQHTTSTSVSVIHRGGATASKPLSIVEEQGKKNVLLVLLSILKWRSEERPSRCCFHVDRLRVPPETDIVTSGLVESDLAYPRALSGRYLSPWSKDPFLQGDGKLVCAHLQFWQ